MRKVIVLLVCLFSANNSFHSNALAQDKGGEVGNPVSADVPKIKTIKIEKEKKEFDYCLRDGDYQSDKDPKTDVNFICVSGEGKEEKYTVLNKSSALKKGINKENSRRIDNCVNAKGDNTVACETHSLSSSISYRFVPKKVLKEVGIAVKTVKYCTLLGPDDTYECELVGSRNMETTLVSYDLMNILKIPGRSRESWNSEMTDIKNCIVNEWRQVACDALRPNGDPAILYTELGSSLIKGLNLKVVNTCETMTKEYVTCQGNVYKLNKESVGMLDNVMLSLLGLANNKCQNLTDKSVSCNGYMYLRVTNENDSSRSLVKESELTGHSEKNQASKTSAK